jgi:hypothetical protein
MPVRTVFEGVEVTRRVDGDRTRVEYRTPAGRITTTTVYTDEMRAAGITITHVEEYAFKDAGDYEALGYLFEHARVESNADGYDAFAEHVGDRGIAVGYVSAAASPMHLVQRELMPLDTFFYEMHDHPDELARLVEQIDGYWRQLLSTAAGTNAEVLLLGANYDAQVQYPPFFAEHIAPGLKAFAEELHARDKLLLTHTDGENRGLLGHYLDCGIDVADSVCPKPMTSMTLGEVRAAFAGRITIMGGVPSVALLAEAMSEREFDMFLDEFFDEIGGGDHLILGISDTTPPQAEFNRILKIGKRVEAFSPPSTALTERSQS